MPAADSLAHALLRAARALARVRAGQNLPDALAGLPEPGPGASGAALRGATADLCYRTLRNRGRADALLSALSEREPSPPELRELAVMALGLLDPYGPLGLEHPLRYAPHTLVDQTVDAARGDRALAHGAGFLNALLRRMLREPDLCRRAAPPAQSLDLNYPAWWRDRIRAAYGADSDAILAAGLIAPPLTLRVNPRRVARPAALDRLAAAGLAATPIGAAGIRLAEGVPVSALPGFAEGWLSVQDEAAQRAAPLLDLAPGQRILDACAAPGGKTGHILELVEADVTALDADAVRLARVRENLDRLGLNARVVAGDARVPAPWWDGRPFDRILADLPCSASGIVRRHPEIRWLRRPTDLPSLSVLQQQILDALWSVLAPNGKLLLVTCSVFPVEGDELAQQFAKRHENAVREPSLGQLLPCSGSDADHDGLYFALFKKIA